MIQVVCGAIVRDQLVLIALRAEPMRNPGVWELPGGKIEPGESAQEALARELYEELGVRVAVHEHLVTSTGRVELATYRCTLLEGEPRALEHAEIRWVPPANLNHYAVAEEEEAAIAFIRASW